MRLRDFVTIHSASVNPQNEPKKHYHLYSLPSFDNNQTREEVTGSEIQSNKNTVPDRCILFNKLNVRFKRIWLIDNGDEDKICSTEFLPLVIDESKVDFYYCYFLLQSPAITDYLTGQNTNTSGSHKRIDPTDFLDIQVNIPSLDQQKKAGSILYSIERKIMLNRQINENLEAMAKHLFNYWFVQFDYPNKDNRPYKSSGGRMVYDSLYKHEIPEDWSVKTIDSICSIKRGASPRPIDDFMDETHTGMPWLKISDATKDNSPFITTIKECIIPEGIGKSVRVHPNTLVVSNSATPGIPKFMQIDACVHDGWLVLYDYDEEYRFYLYYMINMVRNSLLNLASGSIFKNLNTDYLKQYLCVVPPFGVLRDYDSTVRPMMRKIALLQNQTDHLQNQRDELLQLLMNGQASL